MARTKKQTKSHNGFAIPLQPDTELGLAMLIAEDEEGHVRAGRRRSHDQRGETRSPRATSRSRMRRLERGRRSWTLPVRRTKVWARGIDGDYRIACEIKDTIRS